MSEKTIEPYNMDGHSFDPDKYLEKVLKECTLKQVMDTEASIVKETQTLHSDMQTLVYENYNKFITATDTIRKMKTDFKKMETEMDLLGSKMKQITQFSDQITGTLQGTREQLGKLSEKHALLQKLQFLSSLPTKLKTLKDEGNYSMAVHDYVKAQKVLQQYGSQPSFQGIQADCKNIMEEIRIQLKADFHMNDHQTAQALNESGELLMQLNEPPNKLAQEMLQNSGQRLHEQIVMLQDQTERDMVEFVELSIDNFLNNLTLIVAAYSKMFLSKSINVREKYNFDDDFEDKARARLDEFVSRNMGKYLKLVQNRVDIETGHGDSQLLLRALDRLNRKLLAMKNICADVDMTKTGIEIIINAAKHLCNYHLKNLRDFFMDSISSARLSLTTTTTSTANTSLSSSSTMGNKNDGHSASSSTPNLNELISNLYVSTVEKIKGVLQDLLIFLQPEMSFNLKSDAKGLICIEGIREHLLVNFLKHAACLMTSFANNGTTTSTTSSNATCPPNLYLVLSKTCLEFDKNGVHVLLTLCDELYGIDSQTLTHESDIRTEMRDSAQLLLDFYVRLQGVNISQMLRKSVETRDWLNCLEPRSVRAVMKRVVEELSTIECILDNLYVSGTRTSASSDSSRKTHLSLTASRQQQHYRSTWSNYTPSQLESGFVSNIHRLFSERIEIFTSVEFSKISILTGVIKISLKTLLECVRLRTFSKFGLQQIQVDAHYLQMNLWRFVSDENVIHFLLDEILGSAVHRCLEPNLMEPNAVEIICERG